MLQDHELFLARLLDNRTTYPQLLGGAGPGIEAIDDPFAEGVPGPHRPA